MGPLTLARDGMLFTDMRANATVCSPSRAALLTGRFADRAGVPGVIRTDPGNSWGYLAPDVPTLADELKRGGYHTAAVGKWHLGLASPNTPNERGFDFFHGFLGDMMDSYTTHLRHGENYLRRNGEVIEAEGHATDLFTARAIDYLRQRRASGDRPFFLYLAYNAPHFPIEPPAEWLARVKERAPHLDDKGALNVAFVEHLDHCIGQVPILRGDTSGEPRELYFVRREGGLDYGGKSYEALIRGDWKLLQNDPYSPLELYHLGNDPGETTNLADRDPEVFKELSAALRAHIQRGGVIPWQGPGPETTSGSGEAK